MQRSADKNLFEKAKQMIDSDEILNAQEAARLMGAHVETIRRMARKGKIPAFKVGKDWRFRQSALMAWSETNPGIPKKQIHLLAIDDDAGIRKLMHHTFGPTGYSVTTVKNGLEGLERMQNEVFDLVLLDLTMPVMNGSDFIRKMRKTHATIPVIIITGSPDSKQMMEASRFGPLMLVPKPIDKKMLLSTVKLTLEGALSDIGSV